MLTKEMLVLVERAVQNDYAALEQVCEQKWPDILYLCTKLMGNKQDGEDAAQEVMIKLLKNLPRLKKARTFPAWLNRMVTNTCTDMHRKRGRSPSTVPMQEYEDAFIEENEESLPTARMEKEKQRELLLDALDTLPYNYRVVVLLYYYEEMPIKQIALALKTSEQSVKNTLFRARGKLQKLLKQDEVELMDTSASGFAPLVAAMCHQADRLAAGTPPGLVPATQPTATRPRGHGKKWAAALGIVVLACCLALGLYLGDSSTPPSPGIHAAGVVDPQPQPPAARAVGEGGADVSNIYGGPAAPLIAGEAAPRAAGRVVCLFQGDVCRAEVLVAEDGGFAFYDPPLEEGLPVVLKLEGSPATNDITLSAGELPAWVQFAGR